MANYLDITEPDDPRLGDYVRLRETQLRHHLEAEHGLYIAEGEKIIRRALEAGHRPRSVLLAPRWIEGLRDVIDRLEVPVLVVSESLAEQVTGFHVHRGALASMERPRPTPVESLLDASRLVVCEEIVDHANLGAIIRSAAGLGWDGVLLSPGCADPLYRRAVKTAMGTVLDLPFARMAHADEIGRLRAAGFTVVALALTETAVALDTFVSQGRPDKLALLLGTEGSGLSRAWLDAADTHVVIPMRRGVDSLNVAAAAAIACHALA